MKHLRVFLAIALSLYFTACKKPTSEANAPEIQLLNMTPNTLRQSHVEDTVFIRFSIKDRNADLSYSDPEDTVTSRENIFLVDSRPTADLDIVSANDTIILGLPLIPTGSVDPSKGLEAICTLKLSSVFLFVRDNRPEGDTVHFDVYIKDKADNMSNVFTTPDIYINP